jgi:hypothetical protein
MGYGQSENKDRDKDTRQPENKESDRNKERHKTTKEVKRRLLY